VEQVQSPTFWCEGDGTAKRWYGSALFRETLADAYTAAYGQLNAAVPDGVTLSGTAPVGRRAVVREDEELGKALIEVTYGPPSSGFLRYPGKARIRGVTEGRLVEITADIADANKVIVGPHLVAGVPDGVHEWRLTPGHDNTAMAYSTRFLMETAYAASGFNFSSMASMQNATNSGDISVSGFGTWTTHQILCSAVAFVATYDANLVGIDYELPYRYEGWPVTVNAQKGGFRLIEETVYNSSMTAVGTRVVRKWVNKEWGGAAWTDTEPQARTIRREDAFSALTGLTRW